MGKIVFTPLLPLPFLFCRSLSLSQKYRYEVIKLFPELLESYSQFDQKDNTSLTQHLVTVIIYWQVKGKTQEVIASPAAVGALSLLSFRYAPQKRLRSLIRTRKELDFCRWCQVQQYKTTKDAMSNIQY